MRKKNPIIDWESVADELYSALWPLQMKERSAAGQMRAGIPLLTYRRCKQIQEKYNEHTAEIKG